MLLEGIDSKLQSLLEVVRKTNAYYHHCLRIYPDAFDYVTVDRGIAEDVVDEFSIGYAPDTKAMLKFYDKNGVDVDLAVEVGIFGVYDGRLYHKFEGRITFPIFDLLGNPIAFSARILGNDTNLAKYLNSSSSVLFKKSLAVFGLYQALPSIVENDRVIVVEGNLDVITLHQWGIKDVVAPCGTALTDTQSMILRKFTKNIVRCFDNDKAGKKANEKAQKLLSSLGCSDLQIDLEGAKDPDEYIKAFGVDRFLLTL